MYFRLSKFFLHATVFSVAIVTTTTLFPFIVGKYVWFRTSIDLALIFFLLGLVFDEEAAEILGRLWRAIRSPLGIAITAFVALFLLAGFLGVNPSWSFWSNFERGEGSFQMLHLYVFFLLLAALFRKEQDWRKFFAMLLLAALLMVGYGLLAGAKYFDADTTTSIVDGREVTSYTGTGGAWFQTYSRFVGPSFKDPGFRFQGSIGNSSYTAAYLIFILFYGSYLLLTSEDSWKSRKSWLRILAIAFFFIFFILAATRGAFLGFIAAALAALAYLAYSRPRARKWLISTAAVLVLFVVLMVQFRNTDFVRRLPFARIFDISISTETFRHRRIMWNIAWQGWKDRPLLGYGPENYLYVFDRHFDTRYYQPPAPFGAWFDRAHSIIFDNLINAGILGTLAYLSIFAVLFWMVWRREPRAGKNVSPRRLAALRALFIALPVAYLVQALVLFDVLTIYMNLFIFFAFAWYIFIPSQSQKTGEGAEAHPSHAQ